MARKKKNSTPADPRSQTLEELEDHVWGPPPYSSHLVRRTYALRKVPLNEFTVEDLRINIGQNMSLPHLMPLALERLEINLFAAGDYYEGDLLEVVLRAEKSYWEAHPDQWEKVYALVKDRLEELDEHDIRYNFSE